MSPLNRRRAEGLIVLLVGYLLVRAFWMMSNTAGRVFDSATVEATAKILLWGCGCFPIALWLARRNQTSLAGAFGIGSGAWRGATFGVAATAPMIAALFALPLKGFDADLATGSGLLGPFAEEMLFRGFLFGLLWRVAGWSVPASIVISSALFGLAHVPNADWDLFHMLRGPGGDGYVTDGTRIIRVIPATTLWWQFVSYRGPAILQTAVPLAAGGAVLAWIAYRWSSIWPAVSLHACMNLWWDLTKGEHLAPALGPGLMSVAQLLSVALAVGLTLRFSTSGTSGASGAPGPSGARNELTLANDL